MSNERTADGSVASVSRRRLLSAAGVGVGVALAGCSSDDGTPTARPPEASITIRLGNRDDRQREFSVAVNQGESLTDSFSGVLPAGQTDPIEMVAVTRATEEAHDFSIRSIDGQRGEPWDPVECDDLLVEAFIEDGAPEFETECRSG